MRVSLVSVLLHILQFEVQSLQKGATSSSSVGRDGKDKVTLSLCDCDIHSNLGGMGGVNLGRGSPGDRTEDGESKKELRYRRAMTLPTGERLDLVVTNLTLYTPNHINPEDQERPNGRQGENLNGREGCFGRVNIKAPGEVNLKFALFLEGSDTPAPRNYTYDFTMLDFDSSRNGLYEEVTAGGFEAWAAPNLEPIDAHPYLQFRSSPDVVEIVSPEDPDNLTPAQMNASVGFVYANVNEWVVKFKAVGSEAGDSEDGVHVGRNIWFAGRTLLQKTADLHATMYHSTS